MAWDEFEGHFTREVAWEDLRDARFESCTFEGVDWSGKDVRGARFEDCTFVACDLSNMRTLGLGLQHVTLRGCKLVGFDFSSCNALGFQVHMEDCIVDAANVAMAGPSNIPWPEVPWCRQPSPFTAAGSDGNRSGSFSMAQLAEVTQRSRPSPALG